MTNDAIPQAPGMTPQMTALNKVSTTKVVYNKED